MGKYLNVLEVYVDKDICNDNEILCVFTMFEYYLSKRINTNGIKKIIVTFFQNRSEVSDNEMLGVMSVLAPFDDINFNNLESVIEKRMVLLESLEKVIQYIFIKKKWNYEEIRPAFEIIKDNGFVFKEYWKNPKWNPSKNINARVVINIDKNIKVSISLFDKYNKLINSVLLVVLPLGLGALEKCLGTLTWLDNNTVRVYMKNMCDYWFYNISTQELSFYFNRAEIGDAHGQYDLGMMYLKGSGILKNKELATCWLKKSANQKYSKAIKQLGSVSD